MATETEDRTSFRSNLRKDPNRTVGSTRDRRGVFEDSSNSSSTSTSTSYSTGGATRRYNRTAHDRTDLSPSSGRTTTTTSITNKINKLNVNDDERDERDDRKEEEEEEPASRRLTKKAGGPSIASKINNKLYNDEEGEDDSDKDKKEEDEQSAPKKQIKKPKSAAGNKRKERKNLREKRRSTGVVIMPGQPVTPGDDEERQVQENTAKNMGDVEGAGASGGSNADMEAAAKQSEQYIEDLRDEIAKAHREIDRLRSDNLRLKDENSALLRVVGSLSGTGGGR